MIFVSKYWPGCQDNQDQNNYCSMSCFHLMYDSSVQDRHTYLYAKIAHAHAVITFCHDKKYRSSATNRTLSLNSL